jgi:hypothetical protein
MSEQDNPLRNPEHYCDETAHKALAAVTQEEKAIQAESDAPHPPGRIRPLVYICSPYRGATESNVQRARS